MKPKIAKSKIMKKVSVILSLLMLIVSIGCEDTNENMEEVNSIEEEVVSDNLIIKLNNNIAKPNGSSGSVISDLLKELGIDESKLVKSYSNILCYSFKDLTDAEVKLLEESELVNFLIEDEIITLPEDEKNYSYQSAKSMAKSTTTQASTYSPSGEPFVNVWILDTGIDISHEQFQGRAEWAYSTGTLGTTDGHGHGTMMAGIVGGESVGVNTRVTLKAVKVLNNLGSGSTSSILEGLDYVVANATGGNKDVILIPFTGGKSLMLDSVIDDILSQGASYIPLVVAAGNDRQDARNTSPAGSDHESVFTIAATTSNLSDSHFLTGFSNYGPAIDFATLGENIYTSTLNNTYLTMAGTGPSAAKFVGKLASTLENLPSSANREAIVSQMTTGEKASGTYGPYDYIESQIDVNKALLNLSYIESEADSILDLIAQDLRLRNADFTIEGEFRTSLVNSTSGDYQSEALEVFDDIAESNIAFLSDEVQLDVDNLEASIDEALSYQEALSAISSALSASETKTYSNPADKVVAQHYIRTFRNSLKFLHDNADLYDDTAQPLGSAQLHGFGDWWGKWGKCVADITATAIMVGGPAAYGGFKFGSMAGTPVTAMGGLAIGAVGGAIAGGLKAWATSEACDK